MEAQREGQTWLSLRESWQRTALTERAPLMGIHKGGGTASPFGIKLYIVLPLPRQRGCIYRFCEGAGGGERAPVALCREPTEPAGETRGWVL